MAICCGSIQPTFLTNDEELELSRYVTWILDLDQDFTEFYALARQEPKLARMVDRNAGRVLRSPTLFEDVIRTILTTNTLWKHTLRMCRELTTRYGEASPCEPDLQAFPTAERLAQVDEPILREECRMGYRAPYVNELAKRVASGRAGPGSIKNQSAFHPRAAKRADDHQGRRWICGCQPAHVARAL